MSKHYLNLLGSRSIHGIGLFSSSLSSPQSLNCIACNWNTSVIASSRSPPHITPFRALIIWAQARRGSSGFARCYARRRLARNGTDDDEQDAEEEYGHNEEIAALEMYSQSARGEALIVHALVDGEEVEVLIFKGFSSSLSFGTSPDPSRSILPARAEIRSIDRVKGPFDPSNVEYIENDISWENFKSKFLNK